MSSFDRLAALLTHRGQLFRLYTVGAPLVVGIVAAMAFTRASARPHFAELDIERLNLVEKDGTVRMIIANRARMPGILAGGKDYPLRGNNATGAAGIIFLNDEGTEDGGITYRGRKTAAGHSAGGGLTFDQYNNDEDLALKYQDENGDREVGLAIKDRPNISSQPALDSGLAILAIKDATLRRRRMSALRDYWQKTGQTAASRLWIGRSWDKAAEVALSDLKGRTRLRLAVDSTGTPTITFFDSAGHVTRSVSGNDLQP